MLLYFWHSYRLSNDGWIKAVEEEIEKKLSRDNQIKSWLINEIDKGINKSEVLKNNSPLLEHHIHHEKSKPLFQHGRLFTTRAQKKKGAFLKSVGIFVQLGSKNYSTKEVAVLDFPNRLFLKRWFYYFFKYFIASKTFLVRVLPYIIFTYTVTLIISSFLLAFL